MTKKLIVIRHIYFTDISLFTSSVQDCLVARNRLRHRKSFLFNSVLIFNLMKHKKRHLQRKLKTEQSTYLEHPRLVFIAVACVGLDPLDKLSL